MSDSKDRRKDKKKDVPKDRRQGERRDSKVESGAPVRRDEDWDKIDSGLKDE